MEEINSHFLKFYSTDKQMIMIFIEKSLHQLLQIT